MRHLSHQQLPRRSRLRRALPYGRPHKAVLLSVAALVVILCTYVLHSCMPVEETAPLPSTAPATVTDSAELHPLPDTLPASGTLHKLFQVRTVPREPAEHYRDAYDPMPPREGEAFVTFEEYLDCVAARLYLDRQRRTELPFPDAERTKQWPYLMVPVTAELRDVKGLMCNISVPIRHLLYVQNFDLRAVSAFFDDLQREFNYTARLKIFRYADNIGFAGAVNAGIRDAMTHPFEEVPFYFLSNNDVRFGPGLLETMMPRFYEATAGDAEVIMRLEAEVAAEPSEYTPRKMRSPLLRSDGTSTYLVTSRLLPDRLRYASRIDQRRAFSSHYGGLFLSRGCETATWGQSRLAIETVGFWDENFYPAYIEDTDYRFRGQHLGFKDCVPPFGLGGFVHYVSVTIKTGAGTHADHVMKGSPAEMNEEEYQSLVLSQKGFYRGLLHVIQQHVTEDYARYKWGDSHKETARGPYLSRTDAQLGRPTALLPLDCWVWDVGRREAIAVASLLTIQHFVKHPDDSLGSPFLFFLNDTFAASLRKGMRVSPTLAMQGTYLDGAELRQLPPPRTVSLA